MATIIQCVSFGSLWWLRPGDTVDHSAVFNTTGFVTSSTSNRCWIMAGAVRFNVNGRRLVERYEELGGAIYASPGLERRGSWNRLLLHPRQSKSRKVDSYLVCVQSAKVGRIDYSADWRSTHVRIVAASSRGDKQETLLLMGPNSFIRTSLCIVGLRCLLDHFEVIGRLLRLRRNQNDCPPNRGGTALI